jgi:hypothetical protein
MSVNVGFDTVTAYQIGCIIKNRNFFFQVERVDAD